MKKNKVPFVSWLKFSISFEVQYLSVTALTKLHSVMSQHLDHLIYSLFCPQAVQHRLDIHHYRNILLSLLSVYQTVTEVGQNKCLEIMLM